MIHRLLITLSVPLLLTIGCSSSDPIVAEVLDKEYRGSDIAIDLTSPEAERIRAAAPTEEAFQAWAAEEAPRKLRTLIMKRLLNDYVWEHQLKPTKEETLTYLATQEAGSARLHRGSSEDAETRAYNAIREWKLNRALHAQHGGAIYRVSADYVEPFDAYQAYFRECESEGRMKINDEGLRHAFWDTGWYTEQHSPLPPAEGEVHLRTPPWER